MVDDGTAARDEVTSAAALSANRLITDRMRRNRRI